MKPSKLVLLSMLLLSEWATANGIIVHAVRKLRLSYGDPLPEKNFYVNLGARDGIAVGDRLPVVRNVAIRDSFSDSTIHQILVPLGQMEILTVGDTASIGRAEPLASGIPSPTLQYSGFLVGDEVLAKTSLPSGPTTP